MVEQKKEGNVARTKKLRAGVFSFAGCFGCQLQILKLEDFAEVLEKVDFVDFELADEERDEGELDVAFVEGGVNRKEQIPELKQVRKRAKFLVAMGACACDTGLPGMKSFLECGEAEAERIVYGQEFRKNLHSVSPRPVDEYVQVDYYLRGCPIERTELHRVIKELLLGRIPRERHNSVCMECKIKENACFLDRGVPCMGPVSAGGCFALCPSNNFPCEGCRGPFREANLPAFEELLSELGVSPLRRKEMITRFAGRSKNFKEYCTSKGWNAPEKEAAMKPKPVKRNVK